MSNNSFLFIPSDKARYFYNREILTADSIIIDFEDSIDEKYLIENIFKINDIFNDVDLNSVYIRIHKNKYQDILNKINISKIKGVMIPKFEANIIDLQIIDILKQLNLEILILIESPKGILFLEKFLFDYKVNAIFFGSEDYLSEINAIRNKENLFYPRANILNISKAFGVKCYDTIFPYLNDTESFYNEVDIVREMGFDGKMAIHPKQLEYINKSFKYSLGYINELKRIVNLYYENIESNKTNILVIEGNVVEPPHIKRYERIILEYDNGG